MKQLHPVEWDNFVKDTKILAEESNMFNGQNPFGGSDEKSGSAKTVDDLPFYCIGFKSSAPEFTYVLVSELLFVHRHFTELFLV